MVLKEIDGVAFFDAKTKRSIEDGRVEVDRKILKDSKDSIKVENPKVP